MWVCDRVVEGKVKFSADKCEVIYMGKNNRDYTKKWRALSWQLLWVSQLPGYDKQQCKTGTHYSTLIRKANQMLGNTNKGIENYTDSIVVASV